MSKSIREIQQEFSQADDCERKVLYEQYADDPRAGVTALIAKYKKQEEKLAAEIARIEAMKSYENKYRDAAFICGIDEVGRGPLAGPVVAGAVILPKDSQILYLNDSKKLTEKHREELYEVIMREAVAVGIGIVSPEAVGKLCVEPNVLLNDAVTIPMIPPHIVQVPIIKGDAKSVSIAAASIVAKVTRDRLMTEYEEVLPGYGFASNKGYGSSEHIAALKKYGPTPIHRRSFIHNFI